MKKSVFLTAGLLILLGAGFFYGLATLFQQRFVAGDVYPPYSTLRPDPIGAKALFESVELLPGVESKRNYRKGEHLTAGPGTTLIYLFVPSHAVWRKAEIAKVKELVESGMRLVMLFQPGRTQSNARVAMMSSDDETVSFEELGDEWGFEFKAASKGDLSDLGTLPAKLADPALAFEPEVPWESMVRFENLKPQWRPLLTWKDDPVLIERALGKGSVILGTDSYFASNEALHTSPVPRLLAHIIGPAKEVIFDEESKGVAHNANVMTLVYRYRLEGIALAGLVLAILFLWKSASRLVPPYADLNTDGEMVMGKDGHESFVLLLRRSLSADEALRLCTVEWLKSCAGARPQDAEVVRTVAEEENHKPSRERKPVHAYNTIARRITRSTRAKGGHVSTEKAAPSPTSPTVHLGKNTQNTEPRK